MGTKSLAAAVLQVNGRVFIIPRAKDVCSGHSTEAAPTSGQGGVKTGVRRIPLSLVAHTQSRLAPCLQMGFASYSPSSSPKFCSVGTLSLPLTLSPSYPPLQASISNFQILQTNPRLLSPSRYTVVGKFGIKVIHPVIFALLREVIATPILILIAYIVEYRPGKKAALPGADGAAAKQLLPQWSDMPTFVLVGMTGIFGNQLFFILGLATSPSSITAAVIQPIAPIWTLVFALALKMELITISKIFGIVIAVLGSLVTLGFFNLHSSTHLGLGSIYFFLNTACMGAYYLLQKPLLSRYPPITTTAFSYLIGTAMMSIAATGFALAGQLTPVTAEAFSKAFSPLLYAIIGPSICSYLLIAYANTKIDSSLVSASKTLQPLTASLLAYLVLGERLMPQHAIGAIFLLVGMAVLFSENKLIASTAAAVRERTP